MCNKNFADTVMMSYNVIYSVQKKKLAVSEGGSLTGVGLSGFYWIWALYLERVGKAFLGFEINVLFKIWLLFVVLFLDHVVLLTLYKIAELKQMDTIEVCKTFSTVQILTEYANKASQSYFYLYL